LKSTATSSSRNTHAYEIFMRISATRTASEWRAYSMIRECKIEALEKGHHFVHLFITAVSVAMWLAIAFGPATAQSKNSPGQQPQSEYSARRQILLQKYKDGITVMLGAHTDDFDDASRFHQRNNFMYLTGVEVPGAYLMLIPEGLIQGAPAR